MIERTQHGIRPFFFDSVLIKTGSYDRIIKILQDSKEGYQMNLIFASVLQNLIKFIVFIAVALAGVIGGKKYRIYKDSKNAAMTASKKENE